MRQTICICMAVFSLFLLEPAIGYAHEVRPGYLEIIEQDTGQYNVLWKAPNRSGRNISIDPVLPEACQDQILPSRHQLPGSLVERRVVSCGPDGLSEKIISIDGLSTTITDVLVRVTLANGKTQTVLLKPQASSFQVVGLQHWTQAFISYINMGIKHILYGVDHLLFVLGLLLLSRGWMLLLKTITAFTIGHSISLALATFGIVDVPAQPLSAAIALSIVFLAGELVRAQQGKISLTIRSPWMVSFGFGLLHGVGFAGALVQLGLPRADIPLALFCFNVGVEIGQIIFVSLVLIVMGSLKKIQFDLPLWCKPLPVYAMGSVAAFWFIGRLVAML
ncbi:MAG: HupE/UreJ family protein [Desulfobacterales bacterium]|nr:HupE/UreJ family protein [Desulfobacterales bacterium]